MVPISAAALGAVSRPMYLMKDGWPRVVAIMLPAYPYAVEPQETAMMIKTVFQVYGRRAGASILCKDVGNDCTASTTEADTPSNERLPQHLYARDGSMPLARDIIASMQFGTRYPEF